MEIFDHPIFYILPETALLALSLLILIFDLIFPKKEKYLLPISLIGMIGVFASTFFAVIGPAFSHAFYSQTITKEILIPIRQIIPGIIFLTILISKNFLRITKYKAEFLSLIMFSGIGMMVVIGAINVLTLFIGLELTTITIYFLASFNKKSQKSSEAGFKLFIQNAIASAVMLLGFGIIFNLTGSVDYLEIFYRITGPLELKITMFALILITAAFSFKIAIFPFQLWIPDVYKDAPTPIVALLSVGSLSSGMIAFANFVYYTHVSTYFYILTVLSIITMVFGNIAALNQKNIKKLMAYSGISQAGYIIIGLIFPTADQIPDFSPMYIYLIGYTVTNILAFGSIIVIYDKIKSHNIDNYIGLAKKLPVPAFTLLLSFISLIGIPPLALFYGKFEIFLGAVEKGLTWLVAIALINTAISAYYYFRVVKQMYLVKAKKEEGEKFALSLYDKIALSILTLAFLGMSAYLPYIDYVKTEGVVNSTEEQAENIETIEM